MDVAKRGLIIGMALGDGYVQVRQRISPSGKVREERSLRVLHGASQRAYCEWKAARLSWALGGKQVNVTKIKNGPGGNYDACHFWVEHQYFGQVRQWLYPGGEKRFTRRVLDMLTPEGVAIWYMDDGHARKNLNSKGFISSVATDIATQCSEAEAVTIRDWFLDRFGVEFRIRFDKRCRVGKQFFIQANTVESNKFCSIVAPHMPEPMMYKLAHVASLSSHERQTPVGVCECGAEIYTNRRGGKCDACYSRAKYYEIRERKTAA